MMRHTRVDPSEGPSDERCYEAVRQALARTAERTMKAARASLP